MLSQMLSYRLTEYQQIATLLRFPKVWRKLDVTVVCDGKGAAYRQVVSSIEEFPFEEISVGKITVTDKMEWPNLDRVVAKEFNKFIKNTHPYYNLGLTSNSIMGYKVGAAVRDPKGPSLPEKTPLAYVNDDTLSIRIYLKGAKQEGAVDALVFHTKLPKPAVLLYVKRILNKGQLIFHGSIHFRTYLEVSSIVKIFAEYIDHLPSLNRQRLSFNEVTTFTCTGQNANVDELRVFIDSMKLKCKQVRKRNKALGIQGLYYPPIPIPHVVIIENVNKLSTDVEEVLDAFNHFRKPIKEIPYLIGTYVCHDPNCS